MPRPLFSGGLPVYHGRSSESRTFLFSSGSKRLGARPLRGDSLLNIPPPFSFVNTFFPLFFSFFSPLFSPLNLVLFLLYIYTIYARAFSAFSLVLPVSGGGRRRAAAPVSPRKRLTFPDLMVNSLSVNILQALNGKITDPADLQREARTAESASFRRRLVRPGAPANHRRCRPLRGPSAVQGTEPGWYRGSKLSSRCRGGGFFFFPSAAPVKNVTL